LYFVENHQPYLTFWATTTRCPNGILLLRHIRQQICIEICSMWLNASDREIMFLWFTTEINCAPGVQKSFSLSLSLSLSHPQWLA